MIHAQLCCLCLLMHAAPPASATPPQSKTVEIDSPSVGRKLKFNIALPAGYESSGEKRYPVVYLLHGYSSNYTAWARLGAPKAAEGLDLIVVMPDAGNSWYANWAKSDEGQKNDWEDFIAKDLVGYVDKNYRTIARREGRAINGLSMGGYGSLTVGLRHPGMFCSIGSQSGAIAFARSIGDRIKAGQDLTKARPKLSDKPNDEIQTEGFSSQAERTPRGQLFVTVEDADQYDPFKLVLLVPKAKLPHITIDCGTEDGLLMSSQEFVRLLMDNKIPFTYSESEGGHKPAYWAREIGHALAVQATILRRELAR